MKFILIAYIDNEKFAYIFRKDQLHSVKNQIALHAIAGDSVMTMQDADVLYKQVDRLCTTG
jgi:hypothetical protein